MPQKGNSDSVQQSGFGLWRSCRKLRFADRTHGKISSKQMSGRNNSKAIRVQLQQSSFYVGVECRKDSVCAATGTADVAILSSPTVCSAHHMLWWSSGGCLRWIVPLSGCRPHWRRCPRRDHFIAYGITAFDFALFRVSYPILFRRSRSADYSHQSEFFRRRGPTHRFALADARPTSVPGQSDGHEGPALNRML